MNSGNFPKYQIIKENLRRLALSEAEGHRIPTITDLMEKYAVSSTTVLRAIKDLTNEGCLTTIQGSGTFVSKQKKNGGMTASRNIGLVISDLVKTTHPSLAHVIRAVSLTANEHGYNIVFVIEQDERLFGPNNSRFEEDLRSGYYAGLLLVSPLLVEDLSLLFQYGVPFVNISNEYPDARIHSISIDHNLSVYLKLRYCARNGCRNILYISGPPTMNGHRMFLSAFRTCMMEYGIENCENNFQTTDYSENQAYEIVMKRFAEQENLPDAIVGHDGVLARGAYHALEKLGLKVPEDVVMVQGGEIFPNPALRKIISYLDIHMDEMCRKATEMIIKLVQGEVIPEPVEYVYPAIVECPYMKLKNTQPQSQVQKEIK